MATFPHDSSSEVCGAFMPILSYPLRPNCYKQLTILLFYLYFSGFELKPKSMEMANCPQGDWPLSHPIPVLSYMVPLCLYHHTHWDQSATNSWQYYYFNIFYWFWMNLSQNSIKIANIPQGDWPLSHPIPVVSYVVPLCRNYPIHWDQSAINSWKYYYFNN